MEKSGNCTILAIEQLVIEITKFFEKNVTNSSEKAIIEQLKSVTLRPENFINRKRKKIPKEAALKKSLSTMEYDGIANIKRCIHNTVFKLQWQVDTGLFYGRDSGVGKQYLRGNMHTEIVGPNHGVFKSDELRLGLFLLEPNVFYQDHRHESAELYLNLTNGTEWRFGGMPWQEKKSGSIIYNHPYRVHAMRTKKVPFLSVWCWPKNSLKKCEVVNPHRDDHFILQ